MKDTRDTVHLDQVLYILFLRQPLQGQLKLLVLVLTILDPSHPITTSFAAAAQVENHPMELKCKIARVELTAVFDALFERLDGPVRPVLHITASVYPASLIACVTVQLT